MELTPIFVLLIIFGFIFGIIYISIRRKERQMLLEKGLDASVFVSKKYTSTTLKFGLLFIGVAVGILLGNLLYRNAVMDEEAAYFSMIFLFGGLGLVIDYFIEKKENEKMNKN